jgi:hypothetical protein
LKIATDVPGKKFFFSFGSLERLEKMKNEFSFGKEKRSVSGCDRWQSN